MKQETFILAALVAALTGLLVAGFSIVELTLFGLLVCGIIYGTDFYVQGRRPSKKGAFRRLKAEIIALRRTLWFHEANNDLEKLLGLALFATWSVITIGVAFGYAEATEQYAIITALMWMMIGRMWGGALKDASRGAG